jgi:hypothetical protein
MPESAAAQADERTIIEETKKAAICLGREIFRPSALLDLDKLSIDQLASIKNITESRIRGSIINKISIILFPPGLNFIACKLSGS